jgi:hypothetical protein
MGFRCFRLRSQPKVATEWTLIAMGYNCRRIARLQRPWTPHSVIVD